MYWLPYSSHTSHHPSQTPCLPWISYNQKLMHIVLPKCPDVDCIFEIHQLWQSGFSKVYSNCFCSCSFESEIIKIGQSSHKMYSNNIVNFQGSTTILHACTKKGWKLIDSTVYIYIYIYIYVCVCVCVCVVLIEHFFKSLITSLLNVQQINREFIVSPN